MSKIKKPKINNFKFWIGLVLILKLTILYYFLIQAEKFGFKLSGISIISNDFEQLIEPSNMLIENGKYSLLESSKPYSGRLPGSAFPYIIFRFFFNEFYSLQLLIFTQIILSSISVYLLSILTFKITNKSFFFYLSIIIFSVCTYFIKEEILTTTTSFSASSFIIMLFYLQKHIESKKNKYLFFSSIFLLWLFLLRPFTLIYIPIIIIYLLDFSDLKLTIIKIAIVISPLFIFESFWTYRNFSNTGKFIPLQEGYVPGLDFKYIEGCGQDCVAKYSILEIRKLVSSWGGSSEWYIEGTDMNWFLDGEINNEIHFKKTIFSNEFTKDSIVNLKKLLISSFDSKLSFNQRFVADELIVKKAKKFKSNFIKNHPFDYYIKSRFLRIKNLILVNPTMDWPGPPFLKSSMAYKLFKIISIISFFVFFLAIIVYTICFLFMKKTKGNVVNICFYFTIALLASFSFLIELTSVFYFATGYICGYIMLVSLLSILIKKLSVMRRKVTVLKFKF